MNMNSKIEYGALMIATLLLISVGIVFIYSNKKPQEENKSHEEQGSSVTLVQPSVEVKTTKDYSYLFSLSTTPNPNISNIVGYFGNGAFAWYVPDWLVENWSMKNVKDGGMSFSAKGDVSEQDVSAITFDVSTSTERYNAATLHEADGKSLPPDNLVIKEVLLNQHQTGSLSIIIETNTRIYHTQRKSGDQMEDSYYLDGNGKTLHINFAAKKEIFIQFEHEIRKMVEGIGELKVPQG